MRWSEITEATASTPDPRTNPAFKAWFGNSKIVDHDGKPLVVYHGTYSDFSAFDPAKANSEGSAFYFIRDSDIRPGRPAAKSASGYASGAAGGNVMPVYLRMTNPYVTGFTDELADDATNMYPALEMFDFLEFLQGRGYDGIVTYENKAINFGVFNASQVKSIFAKEFRTDSDHLSETVLEGAFDLEQRIEQAPSLPAGQDFISTKAAGLDVSKAIWSAAAY